MRFTYENRDQLDKQYIHDSFFEGFYYDYEKRQISFSCMDGLFEKRINLLFDNVIFTEMQSCEFWGPGNSIYAMWHEEDTHQMRHLKDTANLNKGKYDDSFFTDEKKYIQIQIQLNSGDSLLIICESMEWNEKSLNK